MSGLDLYETSFTEDKILESFISTQLITEKIDCFFRNLHVYTEMGFDVAKRGMLLYGTAGSGKTAAVSLAVRKYSNDKKTAVLIWHTDKFEAHTVKDFIKSFEYKGVDKLILIAEDIGGFEKEQSRFHSDSSLLSLLDNQEKTFKIPVFIIATTNYPENFMGNLTNRPNRFDDKIEVKCPGPEQRKELFKFFAKRDLTNDEKRLLESGSTKEFSPAHIREIIVRSRIHEKATKDVIEEMTKEIEKYNKVFSDKGNIGFD